MGLAESKVIALGGSAEYNPGFLVNGLLVDNDTGNWYKVYAGSPIPHFLPPYTYGWQQTVNGAQVIRFILDAGPAVLPSQNIGNQLSILLTADQLPTRIGYNGLGSSFAYQGSLQQLLTTTVVTLAPSTVTLLPASPMPARLSMMVQAAPDNTGTVYVGGSAVTADESATGGIQLLAGMCLPIDAAITAAVFAVASIVSKVIVMEGK